MLKFKRKFRRLKVKKVYSRWQVLLTLNLTQRCTRPCSHHTFSRYNTQEIYIYCIMRFFRTPAYSHTIHYQNAGNRNLNGCRVISSHDWNELTVSLLELIFMHSSQQQSLKSVYSTEQNFSATTAIELLQINEKISSCNISKHSVAIMQCTPDDNK